jgi:hypothetical protein
VAEHDARGGTAGERRAAEDGSVHRRFSIASSFRLNGPACRTGEATR